MSAKVISVLAAGLLIATFCNLQAADPANPSSPATQPAMNQPDTAQLPLGDKTSDTPVAAITQPPQLPPGSVVSPWTGPGGTGCCGPVGGNGPIMSELVARTGINRPVAGGIMNNVTGTGTIQEIAIRSMFFNPCGSAAWTAEAGLDYIYNNGDRTNIEFNIFGTFASIREYHRAAFHLTLGREIFLCQPAYQACNNWRLGFDAGARYGWSRANLNVVADDPATAAIPIQFARRSDVYGGLLIALHADYEKPFGCCKTFFAGVRGEWCYNWSDVIPTWDSNLQDVNIMLNLGIRY